MASLRAEATRLHRAGQLDDAEAVYQQLLARDAADLGARHMLGLLRLQQGRAAEALNILDAVAAAAPGSADIRTNRALALEALGRTGDALGEFDGALALNPGHALAPFYRANLLWRLDRAEEAADSYARAAAADPDHFAAWFNLGTALMRLNNYGEALVAYEKAHALNPDHPYVLGTMAAAVSGGCDLARWEKFRRQLTAAVRVRSAIVPPLTFLSFSDDPVLQQTCAQTFAQDGVPQTALRPSRTYRHHKTSIAYLSADFRQHATAELIAGLIERHDRRRHQIVGIDFSRDDSSPIRARLGKAFDTFIDVRQKSDTEVAEMLRDAQIDIAVDLKGYTDESRPGILARRPCPVQVGWLGYPGTIGAPWLDYILADATVLPFEMKPFYSEKIVHLPHCYQISDDRRAIASLALTRAAAGLPENAFVFCSFNAAWKISPAMFDIWMRLLAALSGSVLWLLDDNTTATANLKSAAVSRGIDPARLVFAPRIAPADHLARHVLADLFLDTLPYNAHTTASDALWAGLPLLTCMGRTFPARVAASLLTAIGLPELITHSLEEYESAALALARGPARLAALRRKLADRRHTAPLFDTDLFRRHVEAAYQRMMEISAQGNEPQSFTVSP